MPVPDFNSPAQGLIKITPSDTVGFQVCRALLVGTAGAADLIDAAGNLCTAVPLQQGYNAISAKRINSTSLTAANIWAIY